MFERLAEEGFSATTNSILVTAKGMPDMSTRHFLQCLTSAFPDIIVAAGKPAVCLPSKLLAKSIYTRLYGQSSCKHVCTEKADRPAKWCALHIVAVADASVMPVDPSEWAPPLLRLVWLCSGRLESKWHCHHEDLQVWRWEYTPRTGISSSCTALACHACWPSWWPAWVCLPATDTARQVQLTNWQLLQKSSEKLRISNWLIDMAMGNYSPWLRHDALYQADAYLWLDCWAIST